MRNGLVAKEVVSVVLAVVFVVLLSVPLGPAPPLGGLLNPNGGVWTLADEATYPVHQELALRGLNGTVTVLRDTYGVPHIFASTDHDLFFALGYVHAQDRLWQMDIQYRLAAGRLSEVVGSSRLESDAFMRTIGLERTSAAYLATLPPTDPGLRALTAYSDGVNAWIDQAPASALPLEFRLLGYAPERWTPLRSFTEGALLAYGLSADFSDIQMGLLVDKLGAAAVDELFPVNATYPVPIVPSTRGGGYVVNPEAAEDVLAKAALIEPFLGGLREGIGSNNWVVAANRSATGRPLLAGDPHLQFQLPAIWYEAQLTGGDYDVYGVTLPGVPAVLIGFNRYIAWSETNTGADVTDFYREFTSPAHPGAYLFKGQWLPFTVVNETIAVKGEAPRVVPVKISVHGPLVTERGEDLAMRWTGNLSVSSIDAALGFMKAQNWTEFRDALRQWHNPAQNFAFASWGGSAAASTIAIRSNGDIPVRNNTLGRVPLNGTGDFEWTGFLPFDQEPEAVNPSQGFLSSTNQVPAVPPAYTHYLGWLWDPGYRSRRINGLLRGTIAANGTVSFQDMEAFQNDVLDTAAKAFVPYLLNATQGSCAAPTAGDFCNARQELATWDYRMTTDSVAATVWHEFIYWYLNDTFGDEWAAANATDLFVPFPDVLENLTRNAPSSHWFDNVRTPAVERRDDILQRALVDAVATLDYLHGPLGHTWAWGNVHSRVFPHLAGLAPLSRGPYASPGDEVTLNRGGGSSATTGNVVSATGPSWRMVVDVGRPEASVAVFPGGESGNPVSPHYDDQLALWLVGRYKDIEFPYNALLPPGRLESTLVLRGA